MAKKKPVKRQKATAQRARGVKTSSRWVGPFLVAFAHNGVVTSAAEAAGVTRQHVYRWLKKSKTFAEQFEEAFQESGDKLKAEAFRRAHDGVDEPVFQKGDKVGVIRRYSDTLLTKLLGSRFPAEFKESHKHEHSGPDGGPIKTETKVSIDDRIGAYERRLVERLRTSRDSANGHANGDGRGQPVHTNGSD